VATLSGTAGSFSPSVPQNANTKMRQDISSTDSKDKYPDFQFKLGMFSEVHRNIFHTLYRCISSKRYATNKKPRLLHDLQIRTVSSFLRFGTWNHVLSL
jgi:hypothetical protein